MKESFGIEKQAVSWHPPRIKYKRHTEKQLEEDDTEEVAAMGKAWREVKEIQ
jgi:hypothetical protein